MYSDDQALIGLRTLMLLILAGGIGLLVGSADGIGAGLMAGLGALAVLHALVRQR